MHRSLLALILVFGSGTAFASDWQAKIDQLWKNEDAGSVTMTCQVHVVRALPPLLRGSISDRSCVIKAIVAWRDGDGKLASAWLQAGYCGNTPARMKIKNAGNAAVEYASEEYGNQVP